MTVKSEQLLSSFADIIEAQQGHYERVLDMARRKTDVLVSGDVKELEDITALEQDMIARLGKLEEQRECVLGEISSEFEVEPEELKMDYLCAQMPEDRAKDFLKVCEQLKETLNEIDEVNAVNQELIKRALDYINFSIDLLTDTGTDMSGYGSDGSGASKKAYNFIDKRA